MKKNNHPENISPHRKNNFNSPEKFSSRKNLYHLKKAQPLPKTFQPIQKQFEPLPKNLNLPEKFLISFPLPENNITIINEATSTPRIKSQSLMNNFNLPLKETLPEYFSRPPENFTTTLNISQLS